MATIKSYTDIPQSKKLAEFLSPETADMKWFSWEKELNASLVPTFGYDKETAEFYKDTKAIYLPCWSLAALLGALPILERKGYQKAKPQLLYNVAINKWIVDSHIYTTDAYDNPFDACYEMILKLHELKKL